MTKFKVYPKYIKELLTLAIPMIMGNLGIILIGAGDVFVAARHSTNTLASISIANSILSCFFLLGIGLLGSISPLLSNFRGAKSNIKKYFLPTITFALVLGLVICLLTLGCIPFIEKLGFSKTLVPEVKTYLFICAFATFGGYLQMALKEFLQAFEIVFFPNFLSIIGVFVHLALDFIFVFGWLGIPAMGAIGLAVATLVARTILGLLMLFYCLRFIKVKKYSDASYHKNLLKIGFPIASAMLLEVVAFNIITILMGSVSGLYAASQNILLTITTATFMIPMAISNAIAIKVGYSNGAKNFVDLKRYSKAGVGVSVGFMTLCALGFIIWPQFFVKIFTHGSALIKICAPIMILAGIFQIFDGLQVSLGGVFKGIRKTNLVMLGNFAAYWVLGLPLGCMFAYKYKMNLYGFWIGLTISIFTLGLSLLFILNKQFKKLQKAYETL